MFAVVMCLSWYMVSLPPPADQRGFNDLVNDVTWVFKRLNTPIEDHSDSISTSRRSAGRNFNSTSLVSKKRDAMEVLKGSKRVRR